MTRLRLKLRRAESQQGGLGVHPDPPPPLSADGSPRIARTPGGGGGGGGVVTGELSRPLTASGRLSPLLVPQSQPPQPPSGSSPMALTPSKIVALQKDPSFEMQQAKRDRALSQENARLKKQVQTLQQEVTQNKGSDKGQDKGQDKDRSTHEVPATDVEGPALVTLRTQLTTAQNELLLAQRQCQEANAQAQGLEGQLAAAQVARQAMGIQVTEVRQHHTLCTIFYFQPPIPFCNTIFKS